MVIGLWLACSGPTTEPPPPPPDPTGDTGPTSTHTGTRPGPDLVVAQPNAAAMSVTYTIAQTPVREGYDVLATWTSLTTDAWDQPFAATDPDTLVVLLEVFAPPGQVAARLAHDDLGFDLLGLYQATATGRTFVNLSELTPRQGGADFEPSVFLTENPDKSWVLALATDLGDRLQLRAATTLVPDRDSSTTSASIGDATSSFAWAASLGEPLVTHHAWDAWTADWAGVTTDALGKPFDDDVYDELVVGRFPAGTDLEAAFLDLTGAAEATWRLGVRRDTDAELALAVGGASGPFPGFTEGPVWALWNRCTTCLTPFPAWVAVVEVR